MKDLRYLTDEEYSQIEEFIDNICMTDVQNRIFIGPLEDLKLELAYLGKHIEEFEHHPERWLKDILIHSACLHICLQDKNAEVTNSKINKLLLKVLETLKLKGATYGATFHESLYKFGSVVAVIRLGDKLARLRSIYSNPFVDIGDESALDSLLDIMGYCLLFAHWSQESLLQVRLNQVEKAIAEGELTEAKEVFDNVCAIVKESGVKGIK